MKKNQPKKEVSERELEIALGGFASDLESQFPETDEEILAMFKSVEPSGAATPDDQLPGKAVAKPKASASPAVKKGKK
jgi:hypothetical protein